MNDTKTISRHTSFITHSKKLSSRTFSNLDPDLAPLLPISITATSESETYQYAPPNPVQIQITSTDGTQLGKFGDLSSTDLALWTKVRATDNSGVIVTYWTLQTFTFSQGWRNSEWPRDAFHLAMLNVQGGILYDWVLGPEVNIECGDNGARRYWNRPFTPDLYDSAVGAWVYVPGGSIFARC